MPKTVDVVISDESKPIWIEECPNTGKWQPTLQTSFENHVPDACPANNLRITLDALASSRSQPARLKSKGCPSFDSGNGVCLDCPIGQTHILPIWKSKYWEPEEFGS